ncbi:hypothetical protein RHSIM_Rhsim12G0022100 [Rhododendron simsii]|uniref:Bidirectional sugar transporter SWEET n=1 Tax=Rhododendron simsii TaxID=118357 RepID=A0A834G6T9_RHOSS|nr:hypothetical protein RHSIM_Rhsim12G0022100 [Rhododendron simsii]
MKYFCNISGNIVSIFVYLAPLPTFIEIYRKKSILGFQSLPYVVALFSSMLWLYYAFIKTDATLLITINSFGCIIEAIYIIVYLVYAPKNARVLLDYEQKHTAKLLIGMNVLLFFAILLFTHFVLQGQQRVLAVGWVCVAVSVSVFAAPLSIVLQVVRTRSVAYMPFTLSFFLTLSAVMWFCYGIFQKDPCIWIPNVLGFFLGLIQMALYAMYRNAREIFTEKKLPADHIINIVILGTPEVHPVRDAEKTGSKNDGVKDHEKEEENELTDNNNNQEKIVVLPHELPNPATVQLDSPVLIVCRA